MCHRCPQNVPPVSTKCATCVHKMCHRCPHFVPPVSTFCATAAHNIKIGMKLKNKIKNQLNKNRIQLIKQQVNQHIEKGKTRGVYKQAGGGYRV